MPPTPLQLPPSSFKSNYLRLGSTCLIRISTKLSLTSRPFCLIPPSRWSSSVYGVLPLESSLLGSCMMHPYVPLSRISINLASSHALSPPPTSSNLSVQRPRHIGASSSSKLVELNSLLQDKMVSASDKSPKEWWSLLRDLKSNAKWEDPDQHVSLEDLTSFFRTLYKDASLGTDAQSDPDLTFICSDYFRSTCPPHSILEDPLEQPLTPSEISQVIKKLSLGKATGLDNISNEMLRLVGPLHLPFLTTLFNQIYSTACFPSIWKEALYLHSPQKRGQTGSCKLSPAIYYQLPRQVIHWCTQWTPYGLYDP